MILLAACSRQEETPEEATAVPTNTPLPQPTATATTPPTAVPTSTPEPITAAITITGQILTDDGTLTVDQVTLAEKGWLVIQVEEDDQPGPILATVALEAGEHEMVEVQIDPMQATATMFATLHLDDGEVAVFEFPGPDQPVTKDGTLVSHSFTVDIQVTRPAVTVSDQEVGEDGVVLIDSVTSPESGFVALHLDDNGQLGQILRLRSGPGRDDRGHFHHRQLAGGHTSVARSALY